MDAVGRFDLLLGPMPQRSGLRLNTTEVHLLRRAGSERCEAAGRSAEVAVAHECDFKAKEAIHSVDLTGATPALSSSKLARCRTSVSSYCA
jgi:hypothetical protein